MATLETIQQTILNVKDAVDRLFDQTISGARIVVTGLSDISTNLGSMRSGEIRAGTGEVGKGFTGVRVSAPGVDVAGVKYPIVGMNNDVPQYGLGAAGMNAFVNSVAYQTYGYHPLVTPLTSSSFDGDAFSTTAKTLMDLSALFGAPAGIKAVRIRLIARDSAAWGTAGLSFGLSSSTSSGTVHLQVNPAGGDVWDENQGVVTCNADGDIYYSCTASGAGTMDVIIQILGYWL